MLAMLVACASPALSERPDIAPSVDLSRLPAPVRPVLAPELQLAGFWRMDSDPGLSWMTLEIRASDGQEFTLVFYWSTDIGPAMEETVARRENGVLIWDHPLRTFRARFNDPILALYPCRVSGVECLVPEGSLGELERGELWGRARPYSRDSHAFRRLSREEALGFPDEWRREIEFRRALQSPKKSQG